MKKILLITALAMLMLAVAVSAVTSTGTFWKTGAVTPANTLYLYGDDVTTITTVYAAGSFNSNLRTDRFMKSEGRFTGKFMEADGSSHDINFNWFKGGVTTDVTVLSNTPAITRVRINNVVGTHVYRDSDMYRYDEVFTGPVILTYHKVAKTLDIVSTGNFQIMGVTLI